MWLIAPQITTSSTPWRSRTALRSVPRKELTWCFSTTGSPSGFLTFGWIFAPSAPGAKNGASAVGNSARNGVRNRHFAGSWVFSGRLRFPNPFRSADYATPAVLVALEAIQDKPVQALVLFLDGREVGGALV